MSYQKFTKALNDYCIFEKANNLPALEFEKLEALVRDTWIRDGRYEELISYVLENWDAGNCDHFSRPLAQHLIDVKEGGLFIRLWKGILRHRLENLWRYYDGLNITADKIAQINTENFNQFSSSESIDRRVAWLRLYIIDGINEFISGLRILNENKEIEWQIKLLNVVYNLEKPMPQPASDKRKIDEELFWALIDGSRLISHDKIHFINELRSSLEKFNPNELRNFQRILSSKIKELNTWEYWALAYIVRRGCGDDAFDYFKAWVVSKGQKAFDAIKSLDENKLVSIFDEDPQLEDFNYLAEEIYESKTLQFMPPVKVKSGKLTGKRWNEDKLVEMFPSLCKLFDY